MKSKIILLLLLIVNITFSASAFEKASNKYVNEARTFLLIANGFSSEDTSNTEKGIVISIINFLSDKWSISVESEDEVILSGTFTIFQSMSHISHGDTYFSGEGLNEDTGEKLKFTFTCFNNQTLISFYALEGDKTLNMPLTMPINMFWVHQDAEETKILFNDYAINFGLDSPSWKIGTPKQLKNLLKKNPYLGKRLIPDNLNS